jgi:DNA-binding YbaB/EbfC family protein
MSKVVKQVQRVQKEIARVQEELARDRVEGSSGGGAVRAVVTGQGELVELRIAPEAVDPTDLSLLEDLVVSAVNEALRRARELAASRMQAATGGLQLPGLFG